jgi:hypothetical protein
MMYNVLLTKKASNTSLREIGVANVPIVFIIGIMHFLEHYVNLMYD